MPTNEGIGNDWLKRQASDVDEKTKTNTKRKLILLKEGI